MNINETMIDALNRVLTLEIAASDYADIEKKRLSECRRKADFKGFRKGMVPMSMIQRVYGEQCLYEAVNSVVSKELDAYIQEKQYRLLGEPLPSENQSEQEWKSGNDFSFSFDFALSPELNFDVESSDEIPSYKVSIAAKDKTSMIENMKKYYEEKNEGKSEEEKELKSDEEIEKEVTENLTLQLDNEADWRLSKDIRNYFVTKAGISLPEDFLKRWLFVANNGKVSKEDIEKEFEGFIEDLKWQLVRGYLMQKFEFKVQNEDIQEAAESFIRYQYSMYGLSDVPEDMLKQAAVSVLQDQKQVERLVEQVQERKVIEKIKEIVTLKSTKISSTKFRELK